MNEKCTTCEGTGLVDEHQPQGPFGCPNCKGTGTNPKCVTCEGIGVEQPHGGYQCRKCLGKGYQQNPCADVKTNSELYQNVVSEMKFEINNLVWKYVPDSTTMREADITACKIYDLLVSYWNKLDD